MYLILFTQENLIHRYLPIYPQVRIIPNNCTFTLWSIKVITLILKNNFFTQHTEAMSKTSWYKELADDYLSHTGKYIRIFPGGHNEAPAIFKKEGTYWMITSGCTGWDPNKARLLTADSMLGEWKQLPNPCVGEDADKTFGGQSTYILPLPEKGQFFFMADMWRPKSLADSRYIWLPVQFDDKGVPFIKWMDRWNFD